MKLIDTFKLALKNIKENSLRRNIYIIIIALFSIIISIPFFVYDLGLYVDRISQDLSEFKFVKINGDLSEDDIKYLKDYKSDYIVKKDFAIINNILGEDGKATNLVMKEMIDKHVPELEDGRYPTKDGEILCPSLMSSSNHLSDMSALYEVDLQDTIKLTLQNKESSETFEHEYKVVGTYNGDYLMSYSTCYVPTQEYKKLYDEYDNEQIIKSKGFYVDTAEHAIEIANDIKEHGISTFVTRNDLSFMTKLLQLGIILMSVVCIVVLFIALIFIFSYYKAEIKRIALYKSLGYNKKEINRIIFIELIIQTLLACLLAIILVKASGIFIEHYAKKFIEYRLLKIRIPKIPFIIYYLVVILFGYVSVQYNSYRLRNLTVRELLDEEKVGN